MGSFPNFRGEDKKYLKPPTRSHWEVFFHKSQSALRCNFTDVSSLGAWQFNMGAKVNMAEVNGNGPTTPFIGVKQKKLFYTHL